jgi:hypothetical protein
MLETGYRIRTKDALAGVLALIDRPVYEKYLFDFNNNMNITRGLNK